MALADSFRSMDFLEQATALQALQALPAAEALAEITPLFLAPTGDAAADSMVRNALRAILRSNPAAVLNGLTADQPPMADLCRDMAAEMRLEAAVPHLIHAAASVAGSRDMDGLRTILGILGRIGSPQSLPAFRAHMDNPDPVTAALCIQHLGALGDASSLPALAAAISAANAEDRYETCDITTWKAIEAIGEIGRAGTPAAIAVLARFIHHRNPTARRIVLETLVRCGEDAIAHVGPALLDPDTDTRIMAANALRDIAHKAAAEPLVRALEKGAAVDANVGFAIYEALGHTPGMKSLVALTEALPKEHEPSTLMAIVQALETQASPAVGKRFNEIVTDRLSAQDAQAQRILSAVIAVRATGLFPHLYADPVVGRILVGLILKTSDPEALRSFAEILRQCPQPQAEKDAQTLLAALPATETSDRPRLLAVDDSNAMRNFYRTHGAAMGFDVTLAEHGQHALDIVESASGASLTFAIVVVDMNMPVMDGIQFTEKLRAMPEYASTPVLMATTESGRSQASLARKSGVTAFLPKPFTPEMLQSKIGKLLERAGH
ncbi:response regulator [Desulfovibrio psychrotolerans]|uniref:Response regulatory domain-containing protein n=1 Tax=Desulfovibrio psychrotolerans TaxID=415242 RepID=A0A7J0BRY1_9BACT|nr:HEAT repeat domain-containing protein [Desulfovibrio psychrotolerans]GFM36418.1 hypothetical protein DSM19430T_11020 [Desulfovibrio psychrotolerans]